MLSLARSDRRAVARPEATRAARASDADLGEWPHRDCSEFVSAAGIRWHVQRMGTGPALLLVHGTGASTHSWRGLMPLLARDFTVLAPDLPGHAFTEALRDCPPSLPNMAAALGTLLARLGFAPEVVLGHSAGAAVLARMTLDRAIAPRRLISVNGAFFPFHDSVNAVFSGLARFLAARGIVARLVARRAREPAAVRRLVAATGSFLDPAGVDLYARLLSDGAHIQGVLEMMANWDLTALHRDLPQVTSTLHLVVGERDRTVPPRQAADLAARIPGATLDRLPGLGHLAHEEAPHAVHAVVAERLRAASG